MDCNSTFQRKSRRTVFNWFRVDKRRKKIREDRRYLEGRARRLLQKYLAADDSEKRLYYEVIAGAAAACQPEVSDPGLENPQHAELSAETALKVVKIHHRQTSDENDDLAGLITDAYATVGIAYRRAAAVYRVDEEMQRLGTAAVHLTTIANSYMAA
ncbi:hypothetical protein CQ12_41050 [Bradyrhizobium jicamae]|uniref:Uncharacterized protein n=1 Tax=Bradyrhizobium jicamae TaxID=280332 RepID=A0A0R3M203_9BRAD|nr:hypothetical protein CQ12_41050 [Bradyrhizobium jicamae]